MTRALEPQILERLISLVVHDLRNPLSALHSNVGYLESTLPRNLTDAREVLPDVAGSCAALGHIIDNLDLLGAAIQERTEKRELAPVSLYSIVSQVVSRARITAESYDVEMSVKGAEQHVQVFANGEYLVHALRNLVWNAVQHGAKAKPVEIEVRAEERTGAIVVTDGGEPLPTTLTTEAFTAEGQLLSKTHPKGRYGRGLTLYMAGYAASAAGAQIEASPAPGGGNLFILRAPRIL